jgi:uncharacterized protein Yka (UPF0111/DUF47 family)
MSPLRRRAPDDALLSLLEESGRNVQRAALLLAELLTDYPEHRGVARDLLLCEQEGDRIAHDIIHRMNGGGTGRLAPFQSADLYELTRALDDIVDYAEETGDALGLYGVEAPMEQAVAMSAVLVDASEQVAGALRSLRTGADFSEALVEIHRLENEGDRLERDGVASLFADGIDPMVVIRWKSIYDSLESAVDACETVAHVLEGMALKSSRR